MVYKLGVNMTGQLHVLSSLAEQYIQCNLRHKPGLGGYDLTPFLHLLCQEPVELQ